MFICWIKSPSRNGNKKDFVSVSSILGWLFFRSTSVIRRGLQNSWSGRLSWIQWILNDGSSDRLSSSQRFSQYSLNTIFFFYLSTHRHERLHRSHRNATQTVNRSNCHSRSCRSSSRTACQRARCDSSDRGSRLRASACLCSSDPGWEKIKKAESSEKNPHNRKNAEENPTNLRVDADDFIALLACVGEDILVAFNAERMLVSQHISLTGERLVALPAAKMARVPVFGHRLCVFTAEN